MAWTAKSDRFGQGGTGTASGNLGPGQYHGNRGFEFDPSYAPFGSTNPRDTSKDGDCFGFSPPGAGTYDPKLPSTYDPGLPRKHVPFSHSATRWQPRGKDDKPGPGDYKVDPNLAKPQASRTMGVISIGPPILRSSSAPSIPRGHQSFGYEEVGNGRLVRQGPKDGMVFLSGRPQDSAGPGHYEPEIEPIAPRATCGAFMKGVARVPLNGASMDTPGPGHYKAKAAIDLDASPFRMGSSFASQSERGQTKLQAKRSREGPGPGTYSQLRPPKPDLRAARSELQYFGSTVERFKAGPGDKSAVPEHLGPGTYALRGSVRIDPPNAKGFCSTSDRWQAEKESSSPGPGSYKNTQGITDESMTGPLASFSMLSNQGGLAFGSMSKRLNTYGKDNQPGPGQYVLPSMTEVESDVEEEPRVRGRRPKRSRLPGSAFASKTPKDFFTSGSVREGLQRPPPGAYDPVSSKDVATVVRLRSKSEGFLSASTRFPGHAPPKGYHATVGPGRYIPQDITGGKRLGTFNRSICEGMPEGGRPKGLGFEAQDRRFKNGKGSIGPGPGSYNTEPGWITKSHNCYFGDLT